MTALCSEFAGVIIKVKMILSNNFITFKQKFIPTTVQFFDSLCAVFNGNVVFYLLTLLIIASLLFTTAANLIYRVINLSILSVVIIFT